MTEFSQAVDGQTTYAVGNHFDLIDTIYGGHPA